MTDPGAAASAPSSGPDRDGSASELGRFNLTVFGSAGTGKSTLIRAVFGIDVPNDASGASQVTGVRRVRRPDSVVGIHVSAASALGPDGEQALASFRSLVAEARGRPLPEQMHAAWYTMRWNDRPFDEPRAEFVRRVAEVVPVVFVLTQVPANFAGQRQQQAVQLSRYIEAQLLPLSPGNVVQLTNARADERSGTVVHGLPELLDATFASAPEAARRTLTAAQLLDRERRDPRSHAPTTGEPPRWQQVPPRFRAAMQRYWTRYKPG